MGHNVMFDASIHLGQFCTRSEQTRIACKHSQISIERSPATWTDTENGRVDNAIWSLPRALQDEFYPFMDRFFSIMQINQIQLAQADAQLALNLMSDELKLSFQSSYLCSVALSTQVQELHTLYTDLLERDASALLQSRFGLLVRHPALDRTEAFYADVELETAYQRALHAFTDANLDVLDHMLKLRVG